MLGSSLLNACRRRGIEAAGLDLPEVDITKDGDLEKDVATAEAVINCAAYTRVDLAETEREAAAAVNDAGAGRVARLCAGRRAKLVHVSTDYVFDGRLGRPYREDDPPSPVNTYGATKLAGENAVRSAGGPHLIVRTQSLFGVNGRNFVQTILQRLDSGGPLRVVNDQVSSPTYTGHLAEAILDLLNTGHLGIVNASSSGECAWFDFARAIVERVASEAVVEPIRSQELNLPARRPPYSVLDKARFEAWTGRAMPSWEEGLDAYLREIGRLAGR
jgi:dTDP-4-dehydrorhamnose reductase